MQGPAVQEQSAQAAAAQQVDASLAAAGISSAGRTAGAKAKVNPSTFAAVAAAPAAPKPPPAATPAAPASPSKKARAAAAKAAAAAGTAPAPAPAPAPAAARAPAAAPSGAGPSGAAPTAGGGGAPQQAPSWTPTYAANSITRLVDNANKRGAVEHFNWECQQLGMREIPCAFQELTQNCRGGAGGCRTCAAQDQRGAQRIAAPSGIVAKIKAASNADTASRII